EQDEVEYDWCGEDRIAAQKIHLDLHGIAQPSEDVYVVPPFFVVAARRVIVDTYLVSEIPVELRIKIRLKNVLQHRKFRLFLGLERCWIFQNLSVAVAENVGREPSCQSQQPGFESRRKDRLHQRLPGFEIFAADLDFI